MTSPKKPYYCWYEDRYQRVYSQGVDFWTADPDEVSTTTQRLDDFLRAFSFVPNATKILELGCGEGHLAWHLLASGYAYTGVDASALAIEKAKERTSPLTSRNVFLVGDITHLQSISSETYDVAVDNFCLHMLVTDPDRERYFSEVLRVLKKGGRGYFHVNLGKEKFPGPIHSFDEYVKRFKPDLAALDERDAYAGGKRVQIKLPRLPARAENEAGYREEFTKAGFVISKFVAYERTCAIYVTK
jgi:SAM-dependent methyltransferase